MMKLLTKTTIYFLLAMIPLLVVGGYYLSGAFDNALRDETDEELLNDKFVWLKHWQQNPSVSEPTQFNIPEFSIQQVDAGTPAAESLSDTIIYSELEKEKVPYRQLKQLISFNGRKYFISIRKSLVEKNDYIRSITALMLLVFTGLLVFVILFNWIISKKLWKPFYGTLQNLKNWELKKMHAIDFPRSGIAEFNQLNEALSHMASKINNDYNIMKEFTEDAAHEMQTPLAIAINKMEILLQDEGLSRQQMDIISQSEEALLRLNRLNTSLLLIAKIDNGQFMPASKIPFSGILDKYLSQFNEFIADKQLVIKKNFHEEFFAHIHLSLAESMISNMIGNAIKYNRRFGFITVEINKQFFSVENSSELPAIEKEGIFKRFKKTGTADRESNGLGLAIINKVAEKNNLKLSYTYSGTHKFIITKEKIFQE